MDRLHGEFVRPWFEEFDKNGYELRRWAGTNILELTGNEGMQKRFLRHAPDRVSGQAFLLCGARGLIRWDYRRAVRGTV